MATTDHNLEQLEKSMSKDLEFGDESRAAQTSWLRYLVTTISVLFGILVALGGGYTGSSASHWLFASAATLLALSILFFSVTLYSGLYYLRQRRRLHAEESKRAYRERRPKQPVLVRERRVFGVCEAIGYTCFASALLVLCAYLFLR